MKQAGNKFMVKMDLGQPGFTHSACGPFIKNKQRIQNLKEQEIQDIFIKTNQIKLALNMTYGDFKHLPKRKAFEKVFSDKVVNIAKSSKKIMDIKQNYLQHFINI